MSEPIKVGDLVMVVRWPCCGKIIGYIGKVKSIEAFGSGNCRECGKETGMSGALGARCEGTKYWPLAWLRRIDPLAEPESIEHKQEQPA